MRASAIPSVAVTAVGLWVSLVSLPAAAETAVVAWEERIGITDYRDDGAYNYIRLVAPDAAGNTVYAGIGRGSERTVSWINKLGPTGQLLWAYDLAVGPEITVATDMITDKSGNVLVGGATGGWYSQPAGGGFVARLAAGTGRPAWVRPVESTGNGFVVRVAADAAGNIFAAMGTALVKLRPSGSITWQVEAAASHLRIDGGGNAIIAGRDATGVNWLAKRLPDSRLAWKKRLSATPSALILDPADNIVVGYGTTLAKYSSTGALRWRRQQAIASEIGTDAAGNVYVMTGKRLFSRFSGESGSLVWTTSLGSENESSIRFMRTEPSGASAFYGSGCCFETSSRAYAWVAKTDAGGTVLWEERKPSSVAYFDDVDVADGAFHRSGDLFLAVNTEVSSGTAHGAWAIRFDVIP